MIEIPKRLMIAVVGRGKRIILSVSNIWLHNVTSIVAIESIYGSIRRETGQKLCADGTVASTLTTFYEAVERATHVAAAFCRVNSISRGLKLVNFPGEEA